MPAQTAQVAAPADHPDPERAARPGGRRWRPCPASSRCWRSCTTAAGWWTPAGPRAAEVTAMLAGSQSAAAAEN